MPSLDLLLTRQVLVFLLIALILIVLAAVSLLGSRQGPVYTDADHATGRRARVLRDEVHGLSGKPDYIWRENGQLIPEEVKSRASGPHPARDHVIQLGVYFFLIEAEFHQRPAYGKLRYRNRTFRIENTADLRTEVLAIRERYERVSAGLVPPAPCPADRACRFCTMLDQIPGLTEDPRRPAPSRPSGR